MRRSMLLVLAAFSVLPAGCADGPAPTEVPSFAALSPQVIRVPVDHATIQAAVDAASPGDIVHVRAGTYAERVVITTPGLRLHAAGEVLLDGTALGGIGIHVLGTVAEALTDVEVAGFEVAHFERGIVVERASGARVRRNDVHHILDRMAPLALGEGTGIDLATSFATEVSGNRLHHNGDSGLQIRLGSTESLVRANSIYANGSQAPTYGGRGILVTGNATEHNRILENDIRDNLGRGVLIARPAGVGVITGNVVAQNRLHGNYRSGISLMGPVTGTTVVQNDARDNNLSGLAPCYRCGLVDLSPGGNTWARNLGTFNLTDDCDS